MADTRPLRVAVIGCGGAARSFHINRIVEQFSGRLQIPVVCEPSPTAYQATVELFESLGQTSPPNEPNLQQMLDRYAASLDIALITTPHVYHHDQALACMEAGLDVLIEKPLAMNTDEVKSLIEARDRAHRLLVVAYDGGLSPYIHTAAHMLREHQLGTLRSIHAMVWQNWRVDSAGTWQQQPEISGGGFMFNTGIHMLNTVVSIAGEPIVEVAAWTDNLGSPVEVEAVIMGRFKSGALLTLHGAGDTGIDGCESDIRVFCTGGILRTGIWGEFLDLMPGGGAQFQQVPVAATAINMGAFLAGPRWRITKPYAPRSQFAYHASVGGNPTISSEQWRPCVYSMS